MGIDEEIQHLGPLKNVAAAIVDYVRAGARQSQSEFKRYSNEWTLEPDNWINLKFIYTRKYCIHVSLGISAAILDRVEGLEIKPGRWQNYSKLTIESPLQLPAGLRCIETAYYISNNDHRNKNGKPKRPGAA